MSSRSRSAAGFVAASVLVLGALSGCSGTKSNKAACESFSEAFAATQELADTDPEAAPALLEEGMNKAAAKAKDDQLATMMREFSAEYSGLVGSQLEQTTGENAAFLRFVAKFLRIGDSCEVAGVEIEGYVEMKDDLEADGMTGEDLEELVESGLLDGE